MSDNIRVGSYANNPIVLGNDEHDGGSGFHGDSFTSLDLEMHNALRLAVHIVMMRSFRSLTVLGVKLERISTML